MRFIFVILLALSSARAAHAGPRKPIHIQIKPTPGLSLAEECIRVIRKIPRSRLHKHDDVNLVEGYIYVEIDELPSDAYRDLKAEIEDVEGHVVTIKGKTYDFTMAKFLVERKPQTNLDPGFFPAPFIGRISGAGAEDSDTGEIVVDHVVFRDLAGDYNLIMQFLKLIEQGHFIGENGKYYDLSKLPNMDSEGEVPLSSDRAEAFQQQVEVVLEKLGARRFAYQMSARCDRIMH